MTKSKKPAVKPPAPENTTDKVEFRKRHPKKSYNVDDEDENLDLDPKDEDDDVPVEKDPDEKDILSPKVFDPFADEDDDEDF